MIILAGGESRRFGSNKLLADWQGRPLIQAVVERCRAIGPPIVVVKSRGQFVLSDVQVVEDGQVEHHAFGGLLAGLRACPTERAFVCGGDMPLVNLQLARYLASFPEEAVVPIWQSIPQPLCAIYSRTCIAEMERGGDLSLQKLLLRLKTRFIDEADVARLDPQGLSFGDVDTAADLARLASR